MRLSRGTPPFAVGGSRSFDVFDTVSGQMAVTVAPAVGAVPVPSPCTPPHVRVSSPSAICFNTLERISSPFSAAAFRPSVNTV